MVQLFCGEMAKEGFEEEARKIRLAMLERNHSSENALPLNCVAQPDHQFNYESLLTQNPKDVAEQLTFIDSLMFYSIQVILFFLGIFWEVYFIY
jgi:hypothetical protein